MHGLSLSAALCILAVVAAGTPQTPPLYRHQVVPTTVGTAPQQPDWLDQRDVARRKADGDTQAVPTRSEPVRRGHPVGETHNVPFNEQSFAARSGKGESSP